MERGLQRRSRMNIEAAGRLEILFPTKAMRTNPSRGKAIFRWMDRDATSRATMGRDDAARQSSRLSSIRHRALLYVWHRLLIIFPQRASTSLRIYLRHCDRLFSEVEPIFVSRPGMRKNVTTRKASRSFSSSASIFSEAFNFIPNLPPDGNPQNQEKSLNFAKASPHVGWV